MLRMACRVCVPVVLGALAAMPAFAAGIATVTDVVNDGYRQPPGDSERRAAADDELVSDEALRTDRDSSIAVKFIDGSELNVESQSEVVLSDYLYDPAAATASGLITLNTGLFHFNSNNAVQDDSLVLQTPVATIGIRGTQFLVTVADDATIVDILEGKVEVRPHGKGKPILCEGGQSILVESADTDAVCGDLGSFSTAAAPPAKDGDPHDSRDRERAQQASDNKAGGGKPGGGDPGGGDPGGGDPGGGDPGGGNSGGNNGGSHSGHGDGSNPGKGHGNGNGNHGGNNGGSNNPGNGNR